MYTQILKEILLIIEFEQKQIDEFLMHCREHFADNVSEFKNIKGLAKEYKDHQPIWWYTYNCFLYSMLNCALHTMDDELIVKMGFFVRDLHNNIAKFHLEQYGGENRSHPFTIYRGQGLSQLDFEGVMRTQDGLLAFNSFLSTSRDRAVSLAFAESNQYDLNLISVLFEITINPSISSSPFADVQTLTQQIIDRKQTFIINLAGLNITKGMIQTPPHFMKTHYSFEKTLSHRNIQMWLNVTML